MNVRRHHESMDDEGNIPFYLIPLGVVIALALFFALDAAMERHHKVNVLGTVKVYQSQEFYDRGYQNPVIFMIHHSDTVRVKRIRYGKGYQAIEIENTRHQCGWVFSGDSIKLRK
jgi:hypothetical protein